MILVVWWLPGSRSGSSMSTLVYSRRAAFSVSQVSQFCFEKISLMVISLRIAYFVNVRTPLINFIIKFSVRWKRQQIRYGGERWSHHSRRHRVGVDVQTNKFPKTVMSKADLKWIFTIFVAAGYWCL